MIIDTMQNAPRYFLLHPLFKKAFEYILNNDLLNAPDGKNYIGEGLKVIISNAPGKTKQKALKNLSVMIKI